MKLFESPTSGNSYKVRLLLSHLGLKYESITTIPRKGDTRREEFLKINPAGLIPVLQTDDGSILQESNAILFYLAEGTPLLPPDRYGRAQVLRWLFFEREDLGPNVQPLRWTVMHFKAQSGYLGRRMWNEHSVAGYKALDVMESRLGSAEWLVGGALTVADLGLFAYTHIMPKVGYDLARHPGVSAWIARVAAHPRTIPLPDPG